MVSIKKPFKVVLVPLYFSRMPQNVVALSMLGFLLHKPAVNNHTKLVRTETENQIRIESSIRGIVIK